MSLRRIFHNNLPSISGNFHLPRIPFSLPSMSLSAYSAPAPNTLFSADYFASITLAEADSIIRNHRLPRILPKNSIKNWVFDTTEPTVASEKTLAIDEVIPCLEDLLPITQVVESAYKEGARAVCLQIGEQFYRLHFSKLHLIIHVNNQSPNLEAASCLLDRVITASLLLPSLIEELKLTKFLEPLAGFHVTQMPLHSLGCLLNEQWAREDILNARAELIYFCSYSCFLGGVKPHRAGMGLFGADGFR
ncbi:hypothetical protein B0H19DRAFT_1307806, partial [Mycena capillaripes]